MERQKEKQKLRSGFTTGTCGAAAAKAAACWFFKQEVDRVTLMTPKGIEAAFSAEKRLEEGQTWFAVQKDAGDDPDVTDKSWIYASVRPCKKDELARVPETWYQSGEYPFLFLTGGTGIGMVTKPGLACPVGKHAINPVPRSMIFQAVGQVMEEAGEQIPCLISIKIPEGVELAAKTFNPRLGIEGGISILGTSGIVEPMSEQALLDTIRLEIHMKAEAGEKSLILTPGNYGERFLKEELGLSLKMAVTCSNFVADAIESAAREGIGRVLFVGHVGKMIKVAGGVRNTHSKYGDRRMEIIAECMETCGQENRKVRGEKENTAEESGGNPGTLRNRVPEQEWAARIEKIKLSNTTEEALEHLESWGWRDLVMQQAVNKIWRQMNQWAEGKVQVEVVTFSTVYGILGKSKDSMAMIEEWRTKDL